MNNAGLFYYSLFIAAVRSQRPAKSRGFFFGSASVFGP